MFTNILIVAFGGATGSVCRFFINHFSSKGFFPWSTAIVNILGCILAGIIAGLSTRYHLSLQTKYLVFTGFLGGFTTFSAFSLDTVNLWIEGNYRIACLNIALNLLGIVCLLVCFRLFSKLN